MPLDFPSSPTNGQKYGQYVYDSALPGWRNVNTTEANTLVQVGMVPIVPTSVAVGSGSATVSSGGLIFFSGATSISINGCFTSAYRNYRVLVTDLQANNPNYPGISMRLRAAGTDAASEYWSWGVRAVSSAGITQRGSNATTSIEMVSTIGWGGKYSAINTDVNTPFIATNTTVLSSAVGFDASSALWQNQYCFKNDSTSYDGLTFFPSTGNFTGNIKIYGYN
jgi:hypothetical protein